MKKTLVITLIMALIIGSVTSTYAFSSSNIGEFEEISMLVSQLDIEQEIINAENGISDIELTTKQLEKIKAFVTDENGVKVPLDVAATVSKVGQTKNGQSTLYALTAATKTSSGNKEAHGLKAFGTIYWIDNLGINNQLVSVEGGWYKDLRYTGHEAINKVVEYGYDPGSTGPGGILKNETKYPKDNAWAFNYTKDLTGTKFYLHTKADVKNDSMDDYKSLELTVSTSIFD